MPKSPKSRMEWLTEARDNAQRQIEILEGVVDPWGRRSDNGGAVTELRRVLKELNDSLAEPAAEGSDATATYSDPPEINRSAGAGHLQRCDLKAILVLSVFALFLLLAVIALPLFPQTKGYFNWGFGRDWTCTNHSVEVSCLRKP
jgi:hypothetical protein